MEIEQAAMHLPLIQKVTEWTVALLIAVIPVVLEVYLSHAKKSQFRESIVELRNNRDEFASLAHNNPMDDKYLIKHHEIKHKYLECIEHICKEYPFRWIIQSEAIDDLKFVKRAMRQEIYAKDEYYEYIKKTLKKMKKKKAKKRMATR